MTQEVTRLQRERQVLEQQIADLFAFYAKQKQTSEVRFAWPVHMRRKVNLTEQVEAGLEEEASRSSTSGRWTYWQHGERSTAVA